MSAAADNDRQRTQGIDSTVGGRYPQRRLVGVLDSPFLIRRPFLNDMGWEKLDDVRNNLSSLNDCQGEHKMAIFWLLALANRRRSRVFALVPVAIFFLVVGVTAALAFTFGLNIAYGTRDYSVLYLAVYFSAAVGVYFLIELLRTKDLPDHLLMATETQKSSWFQSQFCLPLSPSFWSTWESPLVVPTTKMAIFAGVR